MMRIILKYILKNGYATRNDLIEITGLNIMTITKTVSSLINNGLLITDGTVTGGKGRRKEILKLNPIYKLILGVDFGYSSTEIGVVQFNGQILESRSIKGYKRPIDNGLPFEVNNSHFGR